MASTELMELGGAITQSSTAREHDQPVAEQRAEALLERVEDMIHRRELA
ncbi:hypothetical protein [Saccharothrix violaceirubra]|uniref:Uncharacterized protein n=1 Tax=Saccharothrix violaceirubra TaxID=413306 RepID=A0A7W7WYZ8_9PSEU|nr:hypothetical protein [Saccharothrix violaceirubra]MBB4969049.1 hypothetical protein [Saccharothrix violaceirubra]